MNRNQRRFLVFKRAIELHLPKSSVFDRLTWFTILFFPSLAAKLNLELLSRLFEVWLYSSKHLESRFIESNLDGSLVYHRNGFSIEDADELKSATLQRYLAEAVQDANSDIVQRSWVMRNVLAPLRSPIGALSRKGDAAKFTFGTSPRRSVGAPQISWYNDYGGLIETGFEYLRREMRFDPFHAAFQSFRLVVSIHGEVSVGPAISGKERVFKLTMREFHWQIRDHFDFENFQPLGFWQVKKEDVANIGLDLDGDPAVAWLEVEEPMRFLTNATIRNFRTTFAPAFNKVAKDNEDRLHCKDFFCFTPWRPLKGIQAETLEFALDEVDESKQ